ncbi:MAG: ribonuclease Y [Opitutales bacterium]
MLYFVAFCIGLLIGIVLLTSFGSTWVKRAQKEADRIKELAQREAELELKDTKNQLRAQLDQGRSQIEAERIKRLAELGEQNEDIKIKTQALEAEKAEVAKRESEISEKETALDAAKNEAVKMERLYKMKLHRITEISHEEAKKELLEVESKRIRDEIQDYRLEKLALGEDEVDAEAKRIVLATMQRIASNPTHETSATIVKLNNEDEKGKIIGREGRNIRTFEVATGTTLLIDDTPGSVLVSSFDPVRREIARQALEALLKDGRLNPASIEDTVAEKKEDMDRSIMEWGESALRELRLFDVVPEVIRLIGGLHYRLSNNQNTLEHSIEVAFISSLIASELGLDPVIAKRAGLFHDMGKCVAHEYEGSHAAVAAEILKRNGENPIVVNAVAAHHEEVPAESPYAGLLMVADALSAVRPGARSDSLDGYLRRVRTLEDLAKSHDGVKDAYAIQAGREIRVIVEPGRVDDPDARRLARLLRNQIEEEMQFPNPVKITVIREARYIETAK